MQIYQELKWISSCSVQSKPFICSW